MSDPPARPLRLGRILLGILIAIGVLVVVGREAAVLYVDVLWFETSGYLDVFWKRTWWSWGTRLFVAGATAAVVLLNLRLVASTLGSIQIKRRFGNLEISEQLPRSYVVWAVTGTALLMGMWFGAAVPPGAGLQVLLFFAAPEWGLAEPILGRDAGFYAFVLPLLSAAASFGLVLIFLVAALSAAGYAATGSLHWTGKALRIGDVARIHMASLGAAFLVVLALRFWLGRSILLLDGSSGIQGIVGYTDVEARLPALRTLGIIALASAGAVVWGGIRSRKAPVIGAVVATALGALVLGQVYPAMVQRFRVEPNELERETPFIRHNLAFTRQAFGLDDLRRMDFPYRRAAPVDWTDARRQFGALPVWPSGALLTTFRELEARFRYYDFTTVDVDRYATPQGPVPVAVSVREVDPQGIEDPNWQNLHIRRRYMTGMGAVASAANGQTPEGRPPMFLSAIPPEFSEDPGAPQALRLERPEVFVGARPQTWAIVNPEVEDFRAPDGSPGTPGVDFPEGIVLSSPFRTLALAWRFRDANLLFASEVSSSSRFLFRRQVRARVEAIAPFLDYLADPYPVIHEGRIVWILDGYTSTRSFPLSQPHDLARRRAVSYLRNSVKVTVDGVTGETAFYQVDPEDPLLRAYRAAFPDLVQDLEAMPEGLRSHLRYPEELLDMQARVLFQYHQETAPRFHGQQDVWAPAQELAQGTSPVSYRPEYGIYTLPGETRPEFLLTTVFVPAGRQNLTGVLVARSDGARYGELLLYDIAVEEQAPGPRQVEALVEQDPVISQQFSLWRQGGSQVWSGHLHLVPAENTFLYMEAIFLAAEEDAIPELRRFVVSDGRRVAMESSLSRAVAVLAEGGPEAVSDTASEGVGPAVTEPGGRWPREALDLLDQAEERLRAGDYQGFGEALRSLRELLNRQAGGG